MPDPLDNAAERAKRFYREDPFRAAGGNQFAESEAEKNAARRTGASDSPYATPTGDDAPYTPTFVTTQEHRSGFLLILATGGLTMTAAGILVTFLLPNWPYFDWLPVIALGANLPAAILAHLDRVAIDRGAMDPAGGAAAWWARLLGITATLASVGFIAYPFAGPLYRLIFR